MPTYWSFPQLLLLSLISIVFLFLTFSRHRPVPESFVLVFASHYLVISNSFWYVFFLTWPLLHGKVLFDFSLTPILPAASFYLGVVAICSVLIAWGAVLWRPSLYTKRQKCAFSGASLTILIGLIVATNTPVAVQRFVDTIPPGY